MNGAMSASPALWTARVILAGALGIGIAWVVVDHSPPATPATATASADPAAPAKPPGASYPIPAATVAAPRPTPTPAPVPSPKAEAYAIKRVLDTGGPIPYGRWFWDDAGVPAGKVVITVDLKASVLSIFRGGYEIGTAAIIYGADEKPTPLGVFPILGKDAKHVSNLYDAPMPYTLRLTGDGVSIHGSDRMTYQAATHGCVGLPTPFARKLFGAVRVGDEVIITRGETLAQGDKVKAA
jgi:lipoprotein-anchoring transpeptidase ErfK/SrfK